MRPSHSTKIRELLRQLDDLEAHRSAPEEAALVAAARDSIFDEVRRLALAEGLVVYRRGKTLDAVSMVG